MQTTPNDEIFIFRQLRYSKALDEQVKALAKANQRSINNQIVMIITEALQNKEGE